MQIIEITTVNLERNEQLIREPLSLAIGYFDGMHLGHQALLQQVKACAKDTQQATAIVTFNFQTTKITKSLHNQLLTRKEKITFLAENNFDYYLELQFDESLMRYEATNFIAKLCTLFNIKQLIVGEDFRFGAQRLGDSNLLKKLASIFSYQAYIVPIIYVKDAEKISSSYIKSLIENGEIEEANKLLGYPYTISNVVVHGLANGRKINFRTANIEFPERKIIPRHGVYATYIIVNKLLYAGMTNVGVAPTLNALQKSIIETHIFDFTADIYDVTISVQFVQRMRDEQHFSGIEALKKQLAEDEREIRTYLKKNT